MEILPLWGSRKWIPPFKWIIRKLRILCVSGFPNCAHDLSAAGLFGVGALDEAALCMKSGTPPRDTAWAMSQENVELVRRLLDMFARRDHEGVFEFYDPDIEWDSIAWKSTAVDTGVGGTAGLAGVYRGPEGVRTYWRRWLEAWKDLEFEVEHVLDAGDEVVAVFTIRGGKVVRWRIYPDQQSALEAAGLRE
jgi:ketosteroid isomerase-like protein